LVLDLILFLFWVLISFNFTFKSINVIFPKCFCLTFGHHSFILLFFLIFCQIDFLFSILFSNLRLVGNWGLLFFPVRLHQAYNWDHKFERLNWIISAFFLFLHWFYFSILYVDTLHSIFFSSFFKNYHGLMNRFRVRQVYLHVFPCHFFSFLRATLN
jgi:hypothetical protein